MKKLMPQEIEVWYLIPAIRKEYARIFVKENKLSQREAARILGITEAAVSQYLNSSRGGKAKFTKEEKARIKNSAKKIIQNPDIFMKELYNLCVLLRKSKAICTIHRNQEKDVPKDCDICFQ